MANDRACAQMFHFDMSGLLSAGKTKKKMSAVITDVPP